jgi:hypothetical protein
MLNKVPGSPDWYLDRLARTIIERQVRYDKLENYMIGNHPLPDGDQRYVTALKRLQRMARTNYFGLVTIAPVERMKVTGFRFGATEGSDDDAARIWQASDMDYQSTMLHLLAAVFGDAYILVSPPSPETGLPVLTIEDPRYTAVEMDPAQPTKIAAALRMWNDHITGKTVAILYLPNSIHYYSAGSYDDLVTYSIPGLTEKLLGHEMGSFEPTYMAENPLGIVPMIRFSWRMTLQSASMGEAEDVIDVQDRINSEILNRLVISRSQAYKQRLLAGVKIPEDKGRGRRPPFDPGADMLWVVADPDAKIHEFKEADITQLLKAVRDDVCDMAAITKTPPHYLLGEVVNVSGDALKAAETGLVAKTRLRMQSMGWSWEKVMRLAFRYMQDERADDVISSVIWADPETKSRAELADAMTKEVSAGVPLALAMQRAQYSPEEIKFALDEKRRNEARQAALQAAVANAGAQNNQPGGNGSTRNSNQMNGEPNGNRSAGESNQSGSGNQGNVS